MMSKMIDIWVQNALIFCIYHTADNHHNHPWLVSQVLTCLGKFLGAAVLHCFSWEIVELCPTLFGFDNYFACVENYVFQLHQYFYHQAHVLVISKFN